MINKSHIFGNLLGLLLFSFLMTVASLSTFAQQTIKISGRVTDFNDKPISNCTVMLMDGRFNAIDSVVTDSVGFYLMNGIKPGKYMALTAIKWDEYVRFSKLSAFAALAACNSNEPKAENTATNDGQAE